ncbi:MAG: AsmA family protein [Bacteroidetes bacterium]|nr:AsmA family protein [Bacteroidota bacterium]
MKFLKKFFKWLAIILFSLVVLMFVVPIIFKGKLIKLAKIEINKNVNATVEFGDFSLSLFTAFPNANFVMHDLSIKGLGDFEMDTLLQFNKLELRVGLFSLGSNQLSISSILLDHLSIKTKVLKNGQVNWDIAKESTATTGNEQEASSFKLNLKRIKINNGEFVYDDEEMNLLTQVKDIQGILSGDMVADIANLRAEISSNDFTLTYGGINYISSAKIEAKGGIETDLANSKYTFTQNEILLNDLALLFNGSIEMPAEDITIKLDIVAKQNDFKSFLSMIPAIYNNNFKDIEATGTMGINAKIEGVYNEKQMPGFEVALNIDEGMFKYPDLPGSVKNVNVDLNINNKDGVMDHTIIDLRKLHLDFAGNPIDAQLLVINPMSDPNISGMLNGRIDLENLKNIIPLKETELKGIINSAVDFKGKISSVEEGNYADFLASGEIKANGLFYKSTTLPEGLALNDALLEFKPQYLDLKSFDAQFGKSDFQMKGKVENYLAYFFKDEALKGNFTFSSNLLDLNELMAANSDEDQQDSPVSVFEVPANIDFTLSSTIKKVLYQKIEINDVKGSIAVKDSKVELKNVMMNMLDGNITMDGFYETIDIANPKINFSLGINEIDLGKTFKNFNTFKLLAPIAENCLGKFSASINNYSCILKNNLMPDLNTINANGKINSKNIQLNNAAIFNQISSLLKSDDYKSFNLKDLVLSFLIKDGMVEVKPFVTKIKNTTTTISGYHGVDQAINYNLKFSIPRSDFGGANQVLTDLLSNAESTGLDFKMADFIDINAAITGSITNPKITLDLGKAGQSIVANVKEQVNEKIDATKQEAIQKAQDQADKIMALANEKASQLIAIADSSTAQIKRSAKILADKVRSEAETEAKKIEEKAAGQNELLQIAAKKGADIVRSEAEKKAVKIEEEAAVKTDQLMQKANIEADILKNKAKNEGDALIEKAKGL